MSWLCRSARLLVTRLPLGGRCVHEEGDERVRVGRGGVKTSVRFDRGRPEQVGAY